MKFAHCEVCTEYKIRSLNVCFLPQSEKDGVETIIQKLFSLSIKIGKSSNICVECDGNLTDCLKFYVKIQNALQKLSLQSLVFADPLNIKCEASNNELTSDIGDFCISNDNGYIHCEYLSKEIELIHTASVKNLTIPSQNISNQSSQENTIGANTDAKTEIVKQEVLCNETIKESNYVEIGSISPAFSEKSLPKQIKLIHTAAAKNLTVHSKNISNQQSQENTVGTNTDEKLTEIVKQENLCNETIEENNYDEIRSISPSFSEKSSLFDDSYLNNVSGIIDSDFPKEIMRDGVFLIYGKDMTNLISKFYNLSCELCKDLPKFEAFYLLKEHYKNKHNVKGYVKCCGEKIYTKQLRTHMARHIQPSEFECQICKKSFAPGFVREDHMATHLPKAEKPFKCKECDKSFSSKPAFRNHMTKHVPDDQKGIYKCEICGKGFDNKQRLNQHHANVHSGTKYVCAACGKSYQALSSYNYHLRTHIKKDDRKKIACPKCGDLFLDAQYLKSHMPLHGPKNVACDECDLKFHTKKQLSVHKSCKHSDVKKHKCPICPKIYKSKCALKNHIHHHSREEKYTCRFCPRKFIDQGNMYKHMTRMHPEFKKKITFAGRGGKPGQKNICSTETIV